MWILAPASVPRSPAGPTDPPALGGRILLALTWTCRRRADPTLDTSSAGSSSPQGVAMLHGQQFGFPDWILMLFVPPLIGAAIGLRLGRARSRPERAVIGSSVGGAVGAWLGV